MQQDPPSLPTEVIVTHPHESLGDVQLDWHPQPGSYLDLAGKTYAVLERHHRYQLRSGRYHLCKIALHVQATQRPSEQNWFQGQWIIGDARCRFNARSELLRCAVNPSGPCVGCRSFELIPKRILPKDAHESDDSRH